LPPTRCISIFCEAAEYDHRSVSADALDAGNVVMLDGERRLADEERPVLRLSIIRDVALLRACIRDLQNGRKQIGDSTSWAVASCTD
jgi:hypothetical protein